MNCRRARHLVTPYLDQQLTGQQMLEMQRHFEECSACADEMRSILRIKMLLRSLHSPAPNRILPRHISQRLHEPIFQPLASLPPPRGRRLATALALSCLALFIVAAPFAPATYDVIRATGVRSVFAASILPYSPVPFRAADSVSLRPAELSSLTLMRRSAPRPDSYASAAQERFLAIQYAQSLSLRSAPPAMTLAVYRSR